MVFDRIKNKINQRQLKKELIKKNCEDMIIVNGLNIIRPTYRTFYEKYPFYDAKTDTIDFRKLEIYISSLKFSRGRYFDKECKKCYANKWYEKDGRSFSELKYTFEENVNNYSERVELEHLRKLFMILTGESDYYYSINMRDFIKIVKNYREQYRNLDETISNFENKIHDKNIQIYELTSQLKKANSSVDNLTGDFADTKSKILEKSHEIDDLNQEIDSLKNALNKKEKEYDKLQKDYNFFIIDYQRLKGVKEDFAKTCEEYTNKLRLSLDFSSERDIEDIKLDYEKIISELKRENDKLTELYDKASSKESSKVKRLEKENNSFMISLKEKNEKIKELTSKLAEKSSEILKLKSKDTKSIAPKLSSKEHHKVHRNSKEYRRYRKSVLKRDKICQCCGSSDKSEVHHPLTFNEYNHLGADTNNGIVLCKECHTEYHHQYGYKKECNPVTLAQFLRDYGLKQQSTFDEEYVISKDLVMSGGK